MCAAPYIQCHVCCTLYSVSCVLHHIFSVMCAVPHLQHHATRPAPPPAGIRGSPAHGRPGPVPCMQLPGLQVPASGAAGRAPPADWKRKRRLHVLHLFPAPCVWAAAGARAVVLLHLLLPHRLPHQVLQGVSGWSQRQNSGYNS